MPSDRIINIVTDRNKKSTIISIRLYKLELIHEYNKIIPPNVVEYINKRINDDEMYNIKYDGGIIGLRARYYIDLSPLILISKVIIKGFMRIKTNAEIYNSLMISLKILYICENEGHPLDYLPPYLDTIRLPSIENIAIILNDNIPSTVKNIIIIDSYYPYRRDILDHIFTAL
jgi:hypothetical protein